MELINDFSKLSNESLNYLGIKNTYFDFSDGITTVIKPIHIDLYKWEIISGSELSNQGKLIIEFDTNEKIVLPCTVLKSNELDFNTYILKFSENINSIFAEKLQNFKKITSGSEKRKERRYDVGLENWRVFGLTKPEVYLYHNKKNYKCVINNVSVHGTLLTGETAPISNNETVNFVCNFHNPIENIIQTAILINCNNLGSNYSRYSLQFTDPVSFVWQERIDQYSKNNLC